MVWGNGKNGKNGTDRTYETYGAYGVGDWVGEAYGVRTDTDYQE